MESHRYKLLVIQYYYCSESINSMIRILTWRTDYIKVVDLIRFYCMQIIASTPTSKYTSTNSYDIHNGSEQYTNSQVY